ncbi:MAG TPA: acyltransferase, partial [Bryobacteraceae bacterium]|nr:acyltransferase [Bryobacteraceae bacterium]
MGTRPVYRGHIPELDALRAFGITVVVLVHTWPYRPKQLWDLVQVGWITMDLFFVMSGFLIAGILLDSRAKPDYYKNFYTRRALRIVPVYWAVVGSIVVLLTLWNGPTYNRVAEEWGSAWWFVFYLGNIPTAINGTFMTAAGNCFTPLWSVQVEEQFYLLLPLLIHRLQPRVIARVLIGLACLSPLIRLAIYLGYPTNELVQYVSLPCRMEGFALGALIAVRFRLGPWDIPKRRLSIATVLVTAAWIAIALLGGIKNTTPFNRTAGYLVSSVASAHIVLWLIVHRGSNATAWLRSSPVQSIGKVSYGMYLMHWPIMAVLIEVADRLEWKALSDGTLKFPLVYALTFCCATLSWRYFENPILGLRERLRPAPADGAGAVPCRFPENAGNRVLTRAARF